MSTSVSLATPASRARARTSDSDSLGFSIPPISPPLSSSKSTDSATKKPPVSSDLFTGVTAYVDICLDSGESASAGLIDKIIQFGGRVIKKFISTSLTHVFLHNPKFSSVENSFIASHSNPMLMILKPGWIAECAKSNSIALEIPFAINIQELYEKLRFDSKGNGSNNKNNSANRKLLPKRESATVSESKITAAAAAAAVSTLKNRQTKLHFSRTSTDSVKKSNTSISAEKLKISSSNIIISNNELSSAVSDKENSKNSVNSATRRKSAPPQPMKNLYTPPTGIIPNSRLNFDDLLDDTKFSSPPPEYSNSNGFSIAAAAATVEAIPINEEIRPATAESEKSKRKSISSSDSSSTALSTSKLSNSKSKLKLSSPPQPQPQPQQPIPMLIEKIEKKSSNEKSKYAAALKKSENLLSAAKSIISSNDKKNKNNSTPLSSSNSMIVMEKQKNVSGGKKRKIEWENEENINESIHEKIPIKANNSPISTSASASVIEKLSAILKKTPTSARAVAAASSAAKSKKKLKISPNSENHRLSVTKKKSTNAKPIEESELLSADQSFSDDDSLFESPKISRFNSNTVVSINSISTPIRKSRRIIRSILPLPSRVIGFSSVSDETKEILTETIKNRFLEFSLAGEKLQNSDEIPDSQCDNNNNIQSNSNNNKFNTHNNDSIDESLLPLSHLIVESPIRTLKLLVSISRGIWILKPEWILDNIDKPIRILELSESKYELNIFPGIIKSRQSKRAHLQLPFHLKKFFIAKCENPPTAVMEEIIINLGGILVDSIMESDIAVADLGSQLNNIPIVKPIWLFDSVSDFEMKPFTPNYLINQYKQVENL